MPATSIPRRLARFVTTAALCAAPFSFAQANLLADGGFEGDATNQSLGAGSTAIPGWTVYTAAGNPSANIQWISNSNGYGLSTPYGASFLDLTGTSDSAPFAGVFQSFATAVGSAYRVTFSIGCDNAVGAFACPVGVTASIDGLAAQTFAMTSGAAGNQWASFEYDFTANATTSLLRLRGNSGVYFIGLDNVDVELVGTAAPPAAGVPEPGALALVGLGAVAAALARRRRR